MLILEKTNQTDFMNTGKLVISLDFELMWGVRDKRTIENYGDAIIGARSILEQMLQLFEKHKIRVTFATVGFLFHKNKIELFENLPDLKPTYTNTNLSPYTDLNSFLEDNKEDDYFFGQSLIQKIKNSNLHEIATHTYCHYYCLEPGQNLAQFETDLNFAIKVAKKYDILLKSIVFPRNQYNNDYLEVCRKNGITSFRGAENSRIYESANSKNQNLLKRALRLLDTYINITGYHCYQVTKNKESKLYDIPSSRFLRPYSEKLGFLEQLKFLRIKNAMTYAAKNNLVYHLWWHPHNFGRNCAKNIFMLEKIASHFDYLNKKYKFKSVTMNDFSVNNGL